MRSQSMPRQLARMRGKGKGQLGKKGGGDAAGIVMVSAAVAPAASTATVQQRTQDIWKGTPRISAGSTTLTGAVRSPHVRLHSRWHKRSSSVQRCT
eukprot:COSAG01_NODE_3727_length_5758_cov_35.555654_8_plen_96_part_00